MLIADEWERWAQKEPEDKRRKKCTNVVELRKQILNKNTVELYNFMHQSNININLDLNQQKYRTFSIFGMVHFI